MGHTYIPILCLKFSCSIFVLFYFLTLSIFFSVPAEHGVSGLAHAGQALHSPHWQADSRHAAVTEAHLQVFSILKMCPMLSFSHFCCVLVFFLLLLSLVFLFYLARCLQRLTILGFCALQILRSAHRKHTVIRHGRNEVQLFLVHFPEQIPNKLARSDSKSF